MAGHHKVLLVLDLGSRTQTSRSGREILPPNVMASDDDALLESAGPLLPLARLGSLPAAFFVVAFAMVR